ncbi:hypothetical protein KW805_00890 [Candidatus Pacearchaeota archaeon]|nr:hypothetical protein [Candidatus Pacearchaeota archaeon]
MRKGAVLVIGLMIVGVLLFFKPHITGSVILSPTVPTDCSLANIQTVWDTLFKESSSGIVAFNASIVSGKCSDYMAYKIVGEKTYVLLGSEPAGTPRILYGFYGDAMANYTDILKNVTSISNKSLVWGMSLDGMMKRRSAAITSTDADTEFNVVYKQTPGSWSLYQGSTTLAYIFKYNEISSTKNQTVSASVDANYTYHTLSITEESLCTPSWVQLNTSCRSDETLIAWYNDTSSCSMQTGKPANVTLDCDYNNDSMIGNTTAIQGNVNLSMYVNGALFSFSSSQQGTKLIELRDGLIPRVLWNYSFSTPLNLRSVTIKKQTSGARGYVIVNGISAQKIIVVDKLNASSQNVCIKNKEISNISEVSSDCSKSDETKVSCPGTSSPYSCTIINGTFVVSGLSNSAVEEYFDSQIPVGCRVNWTCSPWAPCIDGTQKRACVDKSSCGTNISRPAEQQACSAACVPEYTNCEQWPDICPASGKKTRLCIDAKNCGGPSKEETQDCQYKNVKRTQIIISILVGAAAITGGLVIYLMTRKGVETQQTIQY